MTTRWTKDEQARARADLDAVPPGAVVYSILRKAGATGWRTYDFFVMRDNAPVRITWALAVALGYTWRDADAALRLQGYAREVVGQMARLVHGDERALRWEEM